MATRHALTNDIKVYHALFPFAAGLTAAGVVGFGVATAAFASVELLFPTVFCAMSYYTAARSARAGYECIKREVRRSSIDTVVRNDDARRAAMIYARSSGQLDEYNRAIEACEYWRSYTSRR